MFRPPAHRTTPAAPYASLSDFVAVAQLCRLIRLLQNGAQLGLPRHSLELSARRDVRLSNNALLVLPNGGQLALGGVWRDAQRGDGAACVAECWEGW